MTSSQTIADPGLVLHVLCDDSFLPQPSEFPIAGSTQRLREQMARFSAPDTHPARRALVVDVIDRLDPDQAEAIAEGLADAVLAHGGDADSVASTVPTATLVRLIGLRCDDATVVGDVEAVVQVIGRGAPPSAVSDAATRRLLDLTDDRGEAVAVTSLLYQIVDATAAAIRNADAARRRGSGPEPAVARTRRVATRPTAIGTTRVESGDELVLEIGLAGVPFGAGPHECPGRQLAEAIGRGASAALDRTDPRREPPAVGV